MRKKPGGGPDRRVETSHGEVLLRERFLPPFRQAAPCAGNDEPWAGEIVALAQDEMRGHIASRPWGQERRRVRAEFVEQVAELCPLIGVEQPVIHTTGARVSARPARRRLSRGRGRPGPPG